MDGPDSLIDLWVVECVSVRFRNASLAFHGTGNGTCSDGYSLLSCGIDTRGTFLSEIYREMRPVNSTTCECRDAYGAVCVSWCYHGPVSGFHISSVWGIGVFEADCPPGTNVIGCHVEPYIPLHSNEYEFYRQYYPSSNSACTCSDKIGTLCIATCASNINNYEIQERTMSGNISSCLLAIKLRAGLWNEAEQQQ